MLELLFAITVTLQWSVPTPSTPSTTSQFKVYKGPDAAGLVSIATVPALANQTNYSYDYNFTDTSPQLFGIATVNSFGESSITSKDAQGNAVFLGKPTPLPSISYLVR